MTVTQHDTRDEEHGSLQTSPGHRLREARLTAKISLDELAARLHLDSRLVEALENDQYAALPEPTFVRGYLRGYARLLGLPPAPIIEAYDRHGFGAPQLIPDIASRPQAQSSDTSVRLVTFIVTAVLIALMTVWWQTQQGVTSVSPEDLVAATPEEPPRLASEPATAGIEESAEPSQTAEAIPAPSIEAAETEDIAPQVVFAEPTPPDTAPLLAEPVVPPDASTAEEPDPEETGTGEAPSAPVSQPGPEVVMEDPAPRRESLPEDRLDIRFQHDSWVEIYDKDDTRLYFGLAKAGQGVSVAGGAPLRVLLGYAREVYIEYNGALFDPAPYMRDDVARFTVGATRAR